MIPQLPEIGDACILLAEDEPIVLEHVTRALTQAGFRVHPAPDGATAVEAFRAHADEIDLLILDVVMPGLNGLRALEQMRALRPDVPVLFTTGYTEPDLAADAPTSASWLAKPYTPRELVQRVRGLIAATRAQGNAEDDGLDESA